MQPNRWIILGAILGALGVALGAYGAHGLEKSLNDVGWGEKEVEHRIALFETAVRYQMYHALALVFVGLLGLQKYSKMLISAGWLFLSGVLIFSGLLYVLTFAEEQWKFLGAIVPIGGTALIAAWVMLAIAGSGCCSHNSTGAKNQPPADV